MTDDPLDAMKWRWSYIQGYLFPSMREDIDPITEALGRLVTALDAWPRGSRPRAAPASARLNRED
jgi:hypothetical protein